MNKTIIALPLCVMVAACAPTDPSTVVYDDAGYAHYTMSYTSDHRGAYSFPQHKDTGGRKEFVFDPKIPAWAAYGRDGDLVMTGSASGGGDFCEDIGRSCRTVTGVYRVYSKKGADCTSSEYPLPNGGAKMPYCMHFHGGYSIHAAYDVPNSNVSHGCIRVLPSAARWLNQDFIDVGTKVVVKPYS